MLLVPSSGAAGKPITFGAYGSGANPMISGADLLAGFAPESVGVFVAYYAGVSVEPKQVFENGSRYSKKDSKTALVPGSFYWDSSGNRVYLRTSGDNSPSGYIIEASQRIYAIQISGKSFLNFENLTTGWTYGSGINIIRTLSHLNFTGILSQYNYKDGLGSWAVGADIIDNVTIDSCEFAYNLVNGATAQGACSNWHVLRNKFHDNILPPHPTEWGGGFYAHQQDDKRSTNLILEQNEAYNNHIYPEGAGLWFDHVGAGCVMRYNHSHHNDGAGLLIEGSDGVVVFANVSHDNGKNGLSISNHCSSNLVYNNTFYNNHVTNINLSGAETGDPGGFINNVVRNNIAFGGGMILNCTWGAENDGTNGSGNVYEYNALGPEAAKFIQWGGAFKSTYAAWETAYGGRTYSVETDPMFTNASGGDFTLRATSLCIDAGADLGPSYSTALMPGSSWPTNVMTGNQYGTGQWWEIGAYLFTGGGSPPGTPTPTPTPTPTRTPTPTPTPTRPPTATLFYPLTPCRVLDTRDATGPLGGPALAAGATRRFTVLTMPSTCRIPLGAKTLSVNLTATSPTANGELRVFPGNLSSTATSAISFNAGRTRANNAHVLLATDGTGSFKVQNNSNGTVHLIVDINGYYQ
jgi:hypothetical protein